MYKSRWYRKVFQREKSSATNKKRSMKSLATGKKSHEGPGRKEGAKKCEKHGGAKRESIADTQLGGHSRGSPSTTKEELARRRWKHQGVKAERTLSNSKLNKPPVTAGGEKD